MEVQLFLSALYAGLSYRLRNGFVIREGGFDSYIQLFFMEVFGIGLLDFRPVLEVVLFAEVRPIGEDNGL